MKCKICEKTSEKLFKEKLLKKYDVQYFKCSNCGFVQPEAPYWLDEAYKNSINLTDTGLLSRNLLFAPKVATIIFNYFKKDGYYLDNGGGYGVFTRLMRDIGFDFYWYDIFTKNLLSRGFEWDEKTKPELMTLFETFEHFVDPIMEMEKLVKISKNILFSTSLVPIPTPKPQDWFYYGLEHGQHVSLYSRESLRLLASKFGLSYYNYVNLHLFTEKNISKSHFFLTCKTSQIQLLYIKKRLKSKTYSDMELLKR